MLLACQMMHDASVRRPQRHLVAWQTAAIGEMNARELRQAQRSIRTLSVSAVRQHEYYC